MRKKDTEKVSVDAGFDFGTDIIDEAENEAQEVNHEPVKATKSVDEPKITITRTKQATDEKEEASTENERTYSKYYKPHPKVGAKGGTIGKPPVEEKERKRSVSIQLSNTQKERYNQAAAKDRRKWPDFVVAAIEEYIEKHNLE